MFWLQVALLPSVKWCQMWNLTVSRNYAAHLNLNRIFYIFAPSLTSYVTCSLTLTNRMTEPCLAHIRKYGERGMLLLQLSGTKLKERKCSLSCGNNTPAFLMFPRGSTITESKKINVGEKQRPGNEPGSNIYLMFLKC